MLPLYPSYYASVTLASLFLKCTDLISAPRPLCSMLSVSVFLERVIAVFILLTVSQPSLHVPSSKMPFQLQMLHPDLIMP